MLEVRLTRGYFRTARRVAPPGSHEARQLAKVLRGLQEEPVPNEQDARALIPPVVECWERTVPSTMLSVLFTREADRVLVRGVRSRS